MCLQSTLHATTSTQAAVTQCHHSPLSVSLSLPGYVAAVRHHQVSVSDDSSMHLAAGFGYVCLAHYQTPVSLLKFNTLMFVKWMLLLCSHLL